MTSKQYYFPYFFDLKSFNKELAQIGLTSYVILNDKIKMPSELVIVKKYFLNFKKSEKRLLTIPSTMTLTLQNNKLFYWPTDHNTLDIMQADFVDLDSPPKILNTKIDLQKLTAGMNTLKTRLDISMLPTFVRIDTLRYDQDYYETFAIIIVEPETVKIIPFDWFNKTGGDYGFVWPATARVDIEKGILYGQGIRMLEFMVDIGKASL
ncbi:MAG: hypothetical protein ACOYMA_14150 [Bacteroidia bacterium]